MKSYVVENVFFKTDFYGFSFSDVNQYNNLYSYNIRTNIRIT